MRAKIFWPLLTAVILSAVFAFPPFYAHAQTPTSAANTFHTGSGNFQAGQAGAEAQMQALKAAGADTCRVCAYQGDYGIDGPPDPAALDATVALCEKYGLRPIVLFEDYGQTAGGYGSYATWKATGAAYAAHFGSRILCYEAMNEPDGDGAAAGTNAVGGPKVSPQAYHDDLWGLSDGVKGVDPTLLVAPGGFCKPNSMSDWTCGGYLSAVADLFNYKKLDAIDLHVYTNGLVAAGNRGPAPLDLSYTNTAPQFSCQNAFDACKATCKITSDPYFLSTEFNYSSALDPADGARGFLTAFFDAQGVVGDDGATRKTLAALVWQIQTLDAPRLKALSVAMSLQGASYIDLDPSLLKARRTGLYTLRNGASRIYVWQDRGYGWSTITDAGVPSLTLFDVPTSATKIDVYDATGLRSDLSIAVPADPTITRLQHSRTVTVANLPGDQTLIFVAH